MSRVPPLLLPRRTFLRGGAAVAAASLLPRGLRSAPGRIDDYPFTLGVASGDPVADGAVIWTRLAPRPLADDGGMLPVPVPVRWEVSADEGFRTIVAEGEARARPEAAHAVHVELRGLAPDRWYWYRFMTADAVSPLGRLRTWPLPGAMPDQLRFAFVSCQKYEIGYYTAFEHLTAEDLDLVVHLGDYIYEKGDDKRAVRPHGMTTAITLADYRRRYALYKTDPALQAAHAMAPWLVTWDDHEFSNDYADLVSEHPERTTKEAFRARRAAAYQAYYEHMPLRPAARPRGEHLRLHRRSEFGGLAQFHILDTRQYRTDQPGNGDEMPGDDPRVMDPAATILGMEQRKWLWNGLAESSARWNVLAQQVMMTRVDLDPSEGELVDVDKWAGYEFERRLLLRHLRDSHVRNPVVLTGDVHSNWANEFDGAASDDQPVAIEWVGTSISSRGDGEDRPDYLDTLMAENPAVKYHNRERGYVRCKVTADQWRTDFRTVPYVSRPGAPVRTRASFVVESDQPRLIRV